MEASEGFFCQVRQTDLIIIIRIMRPVCLVSMSGERFVNNKWCLKFHALKLEARKRSFNLKTEMAPDSAGVRSGLVSLSDRFESSSGICSSR